MWGGAAGIRYTSNSARGADGAGTPMRGEGVSRIPRIATWTDATRRGPRGAREAAGRDIGEIEGEARKGGREDRADNTCADVMPTDRRYSDYLAAPRGEGGREGAKSMEFAISLGRRG